MVVASPMDEHQPLVAEPLKNVAVMAALFACLSGISVGYGIGVTNGALQPVTNHFNMNRDEMAWFVSFQFLFAVPGGLIGSYLIDKTGHKAGFAIAALMFIVGSLLMTLATSYTILLVGRAVAGLSVGMTWVIMPLYTAETAPARLRGMVGTSVELSLNIGIVSGFVASWIVGDFPDSTSWRWMFSLGLFLPVLILLGVFGILPESPRWLASHGRMEEAEEVLNRLLGPVEARKSLELMKQAQTQMGVGTEEPEMSWTQMFTSEKTRWLLFLGGGIAFFSQATGIESIMYYNGVILEKGGMSRDAMLLATVVMGFSKLAAIMFQGVVVDMVGRRPLLILSSAGMCVCMFMLGLSFVFSWGWLFQVVAIIGFVVLFSVGFGPIVYTLNAELYPTSCRTKGLSFAMSISTTVSALVSLCFLKLASLLTYGGSFIFFAFWAAVAVVFVAFLLPETNGKSLEDGHDACAANA